MRVKDPETIEDRIYRENAVLKETRGAMPIIIVLMVVAILMALFVGYSRQAQQVEAYGKGNPYACEDCKNLQRACKEHRNFDTEAALNTKITNFVDKYTISENNELDEETVSKYALYGYDNEICLECDFCTKENVECYSCKFDRTCIKAAYDEVTKSEVFESKLCDACWQNKKAECLMCKDMLVREITVKLVGE